MTNWRAGVPPAQPPSLPAEERATHLVAPIRPPEARHEARWLPHTNIGGTSMRKPGMAARRGVWALARFLHRKKLPGEKEKNALAGCQPRPVVPKPHMPNALRPLGKAFFSFSPALETHGAQKRAKAHSPGPFQGYPQVSFILSGFLACAKQPRKHSLERLCHHASPTRIPSRWHIYEGASPERPISGPPRVGFGTLLCTVLSCGAREGKRAAW